MSRAEPKSTAIHTATRCAICTQTGACLQKKLLFSHDDSRGSSYVQETYPPGAVLPGHAAPCKGIYTVCSGQLKVQYEDSQGRVIFLRLAGEGETVLEPFMGPQGFPSYSLVQPNSVPCVSCRPPNCLGTGRAQPTYSSI